MSYQKFGDWNRVRLLTTNMKSDLDQSRMISLRRVALKAEKSAKEHIGKQDLGWEPLSARYKARKQKEGFSTHTMVRSSSYFQAITSWIAENRAFAGVKRMVTDEEGNEIANIARIQEYGSTVRNIPARPLWGPVFKEVKAWWRGDGSMLKVYQEIIAKKYGL